MRQMPDTDWLAAAFEEHGDHLRAVAYRLLGSVSDADDAVQETWLRLTGTDTSEVENPGGWLTTIVARVSLNMLRSRRYRHEEPVGDSWPGRLRVVLALTISAARRITAIDVIADPARLRRLQLEVLPD
jgi:DNA-directed RNA polymerase specialized sigma24 family protein